MNHSCTKMTVLQHANIDYDNNFSDLELVSRNIRMHEIICLVIFTLLTFDIE